MEEKLCAAAFEGDTDTLKQLLLEDSGILGKTVLKCSDKYNSKTPLHIAAMLGHANFAKVVLEVSSDMCLARDRDGRNPLHIAAIRGKGEVLEVLISHGSSLSVREKIDGGGTVLHLCVKYDQLEMMKIIVGAVRDLEFLNAKNDDGMNVLHLAVLDLQIETIKYLVDNHIEINGKNANGKTALDMILTRRREGESNHPAEEIQRILRDSGGLRSQDLSARNNNSGHTVHINASDWLNKKRDAIMIVATLIATFAFQAGLNPAGGVWQDDSMSSTKTSGFGSSSSSAPLSQHRAGEAIMAHYHPKYYKNFVRANTVAFVSSLSTILLLISGLPFRRRFFMWCLMVIMWLTITSVAMTYGISIMMVTPRHYRKTLSHVIETAVTVWCFVMSLLLLGNTIRLVKRWIKSGGIKRFRERSGGGGGGLLLSRDHDQGSQEEGLHIQKSGISVRID